MSYADKLSIRLDPALAAQLEATANRIASCPSTSDLAREAMRLGLEMIEHRASGGAGNPTAATAERVLGILDRAVRGGDPLAGTYRTREVR